MCNARDAAQFSAPSQRDHYNYGHHKATLLENHNLTLFKVVVMIVFVVAVVSQSLQHVLLCGGHNCNGPFVTTLAAGLNMDNVST